MTNNKVSSHSILAYTEAMVVDHLQGETGLSTVCANRSKDAGWFDPFGLAICRIPEKHN